MSEVSGYLLDTNVTSETRKSRADRNVLAFLEALNESDPWISVLTIGELWKGVAMRQRRDPDAAMRIGIWIEEIKQDFADRILPIDTRVARLWGTLSAERTRPAVDTMLAATAIAHNLALVTRNTKDVQGINVATINPWMNQR
ncbi:MAG: type II toxin-antitoxin system VapC family toxin [Chloroflexia bacterium]|nr:type II toxin-antitoxin system VapC family toxin [Chloroflexia bacterium]MDQ3410770.1 type II toxin-antitoxin system VapC family toxin [Chloroflexota bacterium]